MEETKESKRVAYANRVVAYLILILLSLVAFGFGGSSFMNILLMFGFIFALAIFTFTTEKIDKEKVKDLVYYAIPLIIVGVFGSISNFWLSYYGSNPSGDIISMFGVLGFFVLGYGIHKCKDINIDWILYAILGAMALLVFISTIYSLSRYGFFYITKYAGESYFYEGYNYIVSAETKWLVGFEFVEMNLKYASVYAFILAASLLGLLFIDAKKQPILFWVILGEGLVGLLSFVALGNFKPLIYLIPVVLLALGMKFIKRTEKSDKAERITGWVILGIFAVLLLIVFINAIGGTNYFKGHKYLNKLFNNSFLLLPINQIINATFKTASTGGLNLLTALFGMNSSGGSAWGASSEGSVVFLYEINPKTIEFIMLYEGGLPAFLGLCAFILFVIWGVRTWLREDDHISGEKAIIVLFMFSWLLYMSFNSSVFPYVRERGAMYVSPFRRNGLFYLTVFFAGASYRPFWKKKNAIAGSVAVPAANNESKMEGQHDEISL